MGTTEEKVRRETVMRVLAGEPPGKVAANMGRSDRWVRKWVARYDPAEPGLPSGVPATATSPRAPLSGQPHAVAPQRGPRDRPRRDNVPIVVEFR